MIHLFLTIAPVFAEVKGGVIEDQSHILQIFWGSDPVIKFTLIILACFSIISWAIILYKYRELRRLKTFCGRFYSLFSKARSLKDLAKYSGPPNPLNNIFSVGIGALHESSKKKSSLEVVRKTIDQSVADEVEKIESYVPFLATTASATPFIGLFGTVWGILVAFWQIGQAGSSSLAVVGPYIAEALIATAMGLAAAIPAVIFYNFFVNRIRALGRRIQKYSEDLLLQIEKEYFD